MFLGILADFAQMTSDPVTQSPGHSVKLKRISLQ